MNEIQTVRLSIGMHLIHLQIYTAERWQQLSDTVMAALKGSTFTNIGSYSYDRYSEYRPWQPRSAYEWKGPQLPYQNDQCQKNIFHRLVRHFLILLSR